MCIHPQKVDKPMKKICFWILALGMMAGALALADPAFAAGGPVPRAISMQDAATPVAERMHDFHNLLMVIITTITVFVMLLLLFIIVRFNARANPKPAQFTHNVFVEIVWTLVPVLILVVIAVPSLKLLYYSDRTHTPEMTLKIIGNQWNWTYEYPDHDNITFTSFMIPDDKIDAAAGQQRLLSTDNPVVLPVDTDIQLLVTASDVLHSFAMPAFGVKIDAVPGRTNETWIRITKPGVYYGQCSELCGKDHAFMPIEIHAVPKEDFEAWLEKAREEFASLSNERPPIRLAQAEVTE